MKKAVKKSKKKAKKVKAVKSTKKPQKAQPKAPELTQPNPDEPVVDLDEGPDEDEFFADNDVDISEVEDCDLDD